MTTGCHELRSKADEGRADDRAHQFGQGGTELDALEALHPGELRRIVTEALDRYYDHDLQGRWDTLLSDRRAALAAIAADVHAEYVDALRPHQEECERLAWEANHLREDVRMVFAKMTADMTERAPDDVLAPLSEFESEREADDHPDPLFDSRRAYGDQIARYKLFQGRDQEWAARHREKRKLKAREARANKKTAEQPRDSSMLESRREAKRGEAKRDSGMLESRTDPETRGVS